MFESEEVNATETIRELSELIEFTVRVSPETVMEEPTFKFVLNWVLVPVSVVVPLVVTVPVPVDEKSTCNNDFAEVVPTPTLPARVVLYIFPPPASVHKLLPPPEGVCQLANPLASEVSTLPAPWLPSTNLKLPATSSLADGDTIPMPILPPVVKSVTTLSPEVVNLAISVLLAYILTPSHCEERNPPTASCVPTAASVPKTSQLPFRK